MVECKKIVSNKRNLILKNHNLVISVIIPVYNEKNSVREVINRIPNTYQYEIIAIDDGSTDNSIKMIKMADKPVKILKHKQNQGYGASILTGFNHAKGDIIVTMDSDGQHNPEEIPKLIMPILRNEADMVIGSRYLGKSTYRIPLHTRVGEYIVSLCLKGLYGQKVKNNQSGFRAFNKNCLILFKDIIFYEYGLCTEALFKAASNKLKIAEIPVTINHRLYGVSSVILIKIILSIFFCILGFGLKRFKIKNRSIIPKSILNRGFKLFKRFLNKSY